MRSLLNLALAFSAHKILKPAIAWPAPAPAAVAVAPPAQYTADPSLGSGTGSFKDSAHFRVWGSSDSVASTTLKIMEAAHQCFVEELGWRTPGLSFKGGDNGPWIKTNIYPVAADTMPGAAAQTWTDNAKGFSFLKIVTQYMTNPSVIVHEYGHAIHYSEKNWIDQTLTGAWWEPIANWFADLYLATPTCSKAKQAAGLPESDSVFQPRTIISNSYKVLVDGTSGDANYYEAWPFITYIQNNPDGYPGLGNTTLQNMIRKYKINSNETPLHSLERLLNGATTIQKVVGRYWAHMAFVDIGHPKAQQVFNSQRSGLNYANLDSTGSGNYNVKSARAPRYMGANIIPLKNLEATTSVTITSSGKYTATIAVKSGSTFKYTDVVDGKASVDVSKGDEAMLVVAHTPALVQYDPFKLSAEVQKGLSYSLKITGATA